MAHSPFSRFSSALLAGNVLLFGGCCANNVCDRDDSQADAIRLVFARAPATNGFATADLDTVVIQRYPLSLTAANIRTTTPETVTLIRTTAQAYDTLLLNNTTPFPQASTSKLDQYKYVVRYFNRAVRPRSIPVLVIDAVRLSGSYEGDGCCTYYVNSQKQVTFRKDSAATQTIVDLQKTAAVLTITK